MAGCHSSQRRTECDDNYMHTERKVWRSNHGHIFINGSMVKTVCSAILFWAIGVGLRRIQRML